jgi:hypothetical protein
VKDNYLFQINEMSDSIRGQLYKDFLKQYKSFHSSTVKSNELLYANAQSEWNLLKNDKEKLKNKLQEYSSNNMRKKGILLQYWSTNLKATKSKTNNASTL